MNVDRPALVRVAAGLSRSADQSAGRAAEHVRARPMLEHLGLPRRFTRISGEIMVLAGGRPAAVRQSRAEFVRHASAAVQDARDAAHALRMTEHAGAVQAATEMERSAQKASGYVAKAESGKRRLDSAQTYENTVSEFPRMFARHSEVVSSLAKELERTPSAAADVTVGDAAEEARGALGSLARAQSRLSDTTLKGVRQKKLAASRSTYVENASRAVDQARNTIDALRHVGAKPSLVERLQYGIASVEASIARAESGDRLVGDRGAAPLRALERALADVPPLAEATAHAPSAPQPRQSAEVAAREERIAQLLQLRDEVATITAP